MNVLVTGATGFLGSHLCPRLINEGYNVTILRRSSSDTTYLKGLNLNHMVGDITDSVAVDRAVKEQDMVIHAAAQIGQHSNRELQTRVNVDGTKNVVVASKKYQVKRLLYVSSIATIGIPFGPNFTADETFPLTIEKNDLNYYISKQQSEEEVLKGCKNGLDTLIVNPAWIFGPFWSSFRGGELIDKVERNLIVPYFFGGICAVHVNDVVNGILNALKQGRKGERYILGGENLSYRLIAEIASDCLGLKRIFIPVPSFVTGMMAKIFEMINKFTGKRPYLTFDEHRYVNRYHYYDSSKAVKELQYKYRPFKKIVEEYIEYKRIKNTP